MKKIMKESGLPVVDYVSFYSMEYNNFGDKMDMIILNISMVHRL